MCNLVYLALEGTANFFGSIIHQGSEYFSAIDLNPQENFEQFWELARSATNYFIVIGLIIAAFSNVTRWQIETFSIKKILPGLIIGFLLANLSLFICRLVIDLSDSIAVTASDTLGRAVGAGNTNGIGKFFEAWLLGIFGIGLRVGDALGNPFAWKGTVGGLLTLSSIPLMVTLILPSVAIIALLPPLLAFIALWAMFIVRHYVVLFLVVVSPLAFISMAFPFSQRWFKAWWQQMVNWVFMKPIAFMILMLATVAISQPIYGSLTGGVVSFIVGMAAIYYAVTIPFKMGGTLNSTLARLSGSLGRSGMYAAAGAGQALERRSPGSRLAAILRTPATLAQVPGIVKTKLEHDRARVETQEKTRAARGIGQHHIADVLEDKLIAEKRKEIEGKGYPALMKMLVESNDHYLNAAIWKEVHKQGVQDFAMGSLDEEISKLHGSEDTEVRKRLGLKAGEKIGDSAQARARVTMASMGATLNEKKTTKNIDGKDVEVSEYAIKDNSGFATRLRAELQGLAIGNNKIADADSIDEDKMIIRDEKTIRLNAVGFLGSDPQLQMNKANVDTWLQVNQRDEQGDPLKDAQGRTIYTLSDTLVEGLRRKKITDSAFVDNITRFYASVKEQFANPTTFANIKTKLEKEMEKDTWDEDARKQGKIFLTVLAPGFDPKKASEARTSILGDRSSSQGQSTPGSDQQATADGNQFGTQA